MLARCANGFGAVALAALSQRELGAAPAADPLAPRAGHHAAKAKSVIFLFMDGGPSQVDTFDPKPRLDREHGQPIKMKVPQTQFDNVGTVLKSPWKFRPRGKCGLPVSDLLPHTAECIDDLAIIRSMTSTSSVHTTANYFIHSGSLFQGRPSIGSWVTYGLGSESRELPGFVVLNSGLIPPGGQDCFNSGFLPANYQSSSMRMGAAPVTDLNPLEPSADRQRAKLDLLRTLDAGLLSPLAGSPAVEAAINNYELACKMQTAVPEVLSIKEESQATQSLYGLDDPVTETFGRQCLIARRLVERGVRFIELLCPQVAGADRWDQHSSLQSGHENNARATDKPIAGLLRDLKSRGMLNDTLVVWAGEFGRTPMAQGSDGRDHNPFGFTLWMAGGGVKGGTAYGATDEYGYYAVENKVILHDLHATMLHLLGIDHERLTYRFGGRDFRLTDVHGNVLHEILA